ncbi:Peptidoglycan-specific endopeptidase, M23 family protein [Geobacillus sp. WSUCF1]|nr:Peptidoglycan-specific endopeptidase, M23 family protein [Geobacillus sp. WSUCF1]
MPFKPTIKRPSNNTSNKPALNHDAAAVDGTVVRYGWSELGGWRLTIRTKMRKKKKGVPISFRKDWDTFICCGNAEEKMLT